MIFVLLKTGLSGTFVGTSYCSSQEPRHRVEEDILRGEALLEAARLAFCPLCLRPLQQFPDEAQPRMLEPCQLWWHWFWFILTDCHLFWFVLFWLFCAIFVSCMQGRCRKRAITIIYSSYCSSNLHPKAVISGGWGFGRWHGQKTWEHLAAGLENFLPKKYGQAFIQNN